LIHVLNAKVSGAEVAEMHEPIELQRQIAAWQRHWVKNWKDEPATRLVAQTSADWSKKLLERSGLLRKGCKG